MVTIIIETAIIASAIVPLATATAMKVTRWLERRQKNRAAKKLISRFDNLDASFENVIRDVQRASVAADRVEVAAVTTAVLSGMGVAGVSVSNEAAQKAAERMGEERGWVRVRTHHFAELAMAAADEAFNEYGARNLSKANDLVTRKFLRDFFRECKDLRKKDMNRLIEVALPLSYIPPPERVGMQEFTTLDAFIERVVPDNRRQ